MAKRNNFVQTIKTIAQSLVNNAGYDKTRTGQIVGINEATGTYSVKVDGQTYNNVKAMDGNQYNLRDIVKVVIPCNQASQIYISSAAFSDNTLGKRVAHAQSVADSKNRTYRCAPADLPPVGELVNGDVWINTADHNKMYRWDGANWQFSGGGDPINTATIILYQRVSSAPSAPSGGQTYTFETGVLNPIPSGWSRDIPSGSNPCYITQTNVTSVNASVTISSWSTPVMFVQDGIDAPTAVVSITVDTISYLNNTATLRATLFVDGAVKTPITYAWTKGTSTTVVGKNVTLGITDLDAVYNCVVTWSD